MNSLVFLINSFNRLLGNFLAVIIVSALSFLPKSPPPQIPVTPPKIATSQLVLPQPLPKPITTTKPVPWGTTEKIGEHQYRTFVANDPVMGTPTEILAALNSYRQIHGRADLKSDDGLCRLANTRAQTQNKAATLDAHKGLEDYMKDPKHWEELNVAAIGENASYGYILSGTHLIEWVFDSDEEHKSNQLNPDWNLACAGVAGVTVDILFGKR